eukprot:SAG11_NODE_13871_length_635_cov_1.059701_1_plen_54_part_10
MIAAIYSAHRHLHSLAIFLEELLVKQRAAGLRLVDPDEGPERHLQPRWRPVSPP